MDFELKHKQGARPAGPRVEAIARLSREFKAQAWPDCEDAGMNRCEYSRYVAGEYSYSEPWGDIKGKVLEAHRQRRERARQKAPIQDGYLSVWAEKESWRPEDAFRLVCGVKPLGASHRPINNLAKVPEAYEGLCGSVYIDAEAISKGCEISRVESKWNERLENPAKISPLEFIAWCEKRGIDTTWLSSIKSVPNTPAAPAPAPSASAPAVARPAPVAAPAGAVAVPGAGGDETPVQRRERLRRRVDYWKAQGVRDFTARVAAEERVTEDRIRKILSKGKTKPATAKPKAKPRQPATPFSGLMPPAVRTR